MAVTPIIVGPWTGIDNVHLSDADTFQPRGELEKRLPALVSAENVDLDDDGWPQRRTGFTQRVALGAGLELFTGAGLILAQDGGTIKQISPADWSIVNLVTELSASKRVIFHLHAGQVFWTNGEVTGRVLADGTAANWGCAVAPVPTLGVVAGALRAGRYMVACTFVDGAGIEHGAPEAAVVVLDGTQGMTVGLSAIDANAVSAKVYVTGPNKKKLYFNQTVAVGALPATVSTVRESEEYLRTQHLSPPIAGDGLFSFRGMLLIYADQYIFPSYGANAHLYEIGTVVEARPENVIGGAGLATGFWTICANGAYWTQGGVNPAEWQTWRRDVRKYAEGAMMLSGSLLPWVGTLQDVALFVSENGLVVGLPDGTLLMPHQDRIVLDVEGKRASLAYREQDDLRQIVFNLE